MKNENKWKDFEMIDKYFPKGDRRRGEALVINAEAFLLGKNEERERILKIIKAIRNGEIDLRYLEEEIQKEEE